MDAIITAEEYGLAEEYKRICVIYNEAWRLTVDIDKEAGVRIDANYFETLRQNLENRFPTTPQQLLAWKKVYPNE